MRLGTCIALELAVAAGAVGGVWFGVGRAAQLADRYVAPIADAATLASPAPLPRARLEVVPTARPPSVFGASDVELLAPLGAAPVTRVKTNHGGTSLSLRLDFANGARAAFKPEQIHPQSDPRREVAAYRLDRLLELGRVPPAKPAAIPLVELLAALEPGQRGIVMRRLEQEAVARGGVLYGELSWWVPEIKPARLARQPIDEREGRVLWTQYLQAGAQIPAESRALVAQISSCVVFDVLIDNADRWSGNNTVMSPDGGVLYFMDNTMSFSLARMGHENPLAALSRVQVFSRGLIRRLRALDLATLERLFVVDERERLGALLQPTEILAVLLRRDHLLRHVDSLIAALGEDTVLAFP